MNIKKDKIQTFKRNSLFSFKYSHDKLNNNYSSENDKNRMDFFSPTYKFGVHAIDEKLLLFIKNMPDEYEAFLLANTSLTLRKED